MHKHYKLLSLDTVCKCALLSYIQTILKTTMTTGHLALGGKSLLC